MVEAPSGDGATGEMVKATDGDDPTEVMVEAPSGNGAAGGWSKRPPNDDGAGRAGGFVEAQGDRRRGVERPSDNGALRGFARGYFIKFELRRREELYSRILTKFLFVRPSVTPGITSGVLIFDNKTKY